MNAYNPTEDHKNSEFSILSNFLFKEKNKHKNHATLNDCCIKSVPYAINSHELTAKKLCIYKEINMLLMHSFAAFCMQDSRQKLINKDASVKFAFDGIDKRFMQELYRFIYCKHGWAGDTK